MPGKGSELSKIITVIMLAVGIFVIYTYGIGIVANHDQDNATNGTAYETQYKTGENVMAGSSTVMIALGWLLMIAAVVFAFKYLMRGL